jgi:hypothetical protein
MYSFYPSISSRMFSFHTEELDEDGTVVLRSGDALHLACAEEHGFQEVFTNNRHMLQAARCFHVTGVNVLSDNG